MKSFKSYILPSIIASVLLCSYVIVDGIFIGKKIGDCGLSAINIAWPITALLQAIGMSIGISGGIYLTRLTASNNPKKDKINLTVILLVSLIGIFVGLLLLFGSNNILKLLKAEGDTLEYANDYIRVILLGSIFQMLGPAMIPLMKNNGKVKLAMIASILSIITNLLGDLIFINILNLDLYGAALASVLSQAVAAIFCLIALRKNLKGFTFLQEDFHELFWGGLAPFLLYYSYSVLIIITNYKCMDYGKDSAVAAYTVLSYLLYIVQSLATGTGDAIQPLFSYNEEIKDYKKNYKYLLYCFIISFSLVFIVTLLFLIFKDHLAITFNLSAEAKQYFKTGLIFYSIGFLFISIYKVICSFLYSINQKLRSNVLTIIEPLFITPLFYFILKDFKLNGIWASFMIIQIILVTIGFIFVIKTKKGEE